MKKRIYLQYHGELIVVHFIYGMISIVRISRAATFWRKRCKNPGFRMKSLGNDLPFIQWPSIPVKMWIWNDKKRSINATSKAVSAPRISIRVRSLLIQKQWNKLIVCMSPLWFRFCKRGGMDDMMWLIMLHTVILDENLHIDWNEQKYTHRVGCCQWESFFLFRCVTCCSFSCLLQMCAYQHQIKWTKKWSNGKKDNERSNQSIKITRKTLHRLDVSFFFSHSIQLARQNSVHPYHCNKIIEWKKKSESCKYKTEDHIAGWFIAFLDLYQIMARNFHKNGQMKVQKKNDNLIGSSQKKECKKKSRYIVAFENLRAHFDRLSLHWVLQLNAKQ